MNKQRKPSLKIITLSLLLITFMNCKESYAHELFPGRSRDLIRQRQSSQNGVLITAPDQDDITAMEFIRRNNIQTPEGLALWLKANFRYQESPSQKKSRPLREILKNKKGSCEDYTRISTAVMHVLGYHPRFFALEREGKAHAVCAFKYNGTYAWLDNSELHITEAITTEDFARHLFKNFRYARILEWDLENQNWKLRYKRS